MALTRPAPLQRLRLSPNEEVSSISRPLYHKTGMLISGHPYQSETRREKDSKNIGSELLHILVPYYKS